MSHDDEVEEMEIEDEAPKPRRRMPRRANSTDGVVAPSSGRTGRRIPRKTHSTDGSAIPTRGGHDDDDDEMEDNSKPTMTQSENRARTRKLPGRSKSSDGSKALPARSKSGTLGMRMSPKRTASGLGGRATPRRTKSSDGGGGFGGRKGRKKGGAVEKAGLLNIFGSDLVSTDKILEDIENAKEDQDLTRLELEDFFMADRENPEEIPMALKELLEHDDRPWESVQFVDDIMDGSVFEEYRDRKKHFMRAFHGVCEQRLIPCTQRAKITLSSGSSTMDEMVELLFFLQSDRAVTELTIKSDKVDESIIRGLTQLFKADKRKWEAVTLQLSGTGPGKPGSPEHNAWAKAMQAATVEMQKVAKERGIKL